MSGMRRVLILVIFLGLLAAIALGCGAKATPTPTPSLPLTPTVTVMPTYTPTATATPTKAATPTPTAATTAQGLPFSEVKFKSGDWVKYQMEAAGGATIGEGTGGDITMTAGPPGIMTIKVVEIAFGGITYEGVEIEINASVGIPGQEVQGTAVSVSLTEKGKTGGKAWDVTIATIFGQQLQCSPGTALGSSEQSDIPQGTTFTTDTYKVPESGRVIKVWKYRTDEGEFWLSNEVPMYMVKSTPVSEGLTITMELLAYGSGAPLSITSAALEASCK